MRVGCWEEVECLRLANCLLRRIQVVGLVGGRGSGVKSKIGTRGQDT